MFGSITKHFKAEVIAKCIEKLGTTGKASLDGVGHLQYDHDRNVITMYADPQMVEKVKECWEENHRN